MVELEEYLIERGFDNVAVIKSDFFQKVEQSLSSTKVRKYCQKMDMRRAADWAYLANRVVGY